MSPENELLGADFVEHCIEHREFYQYRRSPPPEDEARFLNDTSTAIQDNDYAADGLRQRAVADDGEPPSGNPDEADLVYGLSSAEDNAETRMASHAFQTGAPFWEVMNQEPCHDGIGKTEDASPQREMTIRLVTNYRSNCVIA